MRTPAAVQRRYRPCHFLTVPWLLFGPGIALGATSALEVALHRAGSNAAALRSALETVPDHQRLGVQFLIENMPGRDLRTLTADYLKEQADFAYRAWEEYPWRDQVSEATFFNFVLPYASINERRDAWRRDFYGRFRPLIGVAKTPSEAAAILNNKVFKQLNVKYSTQRVRADQSPLQSIESGLASCTGLSILLIDACRAVGVPARFVGTPLWSDQSGNHSWVEIWDNGWHFTGAAEPTGMNLDAGWFQNRAALAQRDEPRHAIYATSFKRTPLTFPCVWDRRVDYVFAVNVTDRYTTKQEALTEGHGWARFRVLDAVGDRLECAVAVVDDSGTVVGSGKSKDERFDSNDHWSTELSVGRPYQVAVNYHGQTAGKSIQLESEEQLFTILLTAAKVAGDSAVHVGAETDPIAALKQHLSIPHGDRPRLDDLPFARSSLSKTQVDQAQRLLWQDYSQWIAATRNEEMAAKALSAGKLRMPYASETFGTKPQAGWSLYLSMHGGGGAPKQVNDKQWQNQQQLYEPTEGIYLAPRAPTDTWNLWHQGHIDGLFTRLIENHVVLADVNPNRVYLMGYSAGGDGAYQLAPRMADRWAAAAMMAGHPNDASPLGLRNIGFAIYMGGKDGAYQRNEVAAEWKTKLGSLQNNDPTGYKHLVTIYPDKGHWMDGEDASAIAWMSEQVRNPLPSKIVWQQDDVSSSRFYWLAAADDPQAGSLVTAERKGQTIDIESTAVKSIYVRFNDQMADLDQPVKITSQGEVIQEAIISRRIVTLHKTITERGDPTSVFSAEVAVPLHR